LERSYLLRIHNKVVERPQHMLMRVAVGIHKEDIDSACKTYNLLSERWFTHASPTLFNAGTPRPQLSSCFLVCMKVRARCSAAAPAPAAEHCGTRYPHTSSASTHLPCRLGTSRHPPRHTRHHPHHHTLATARRTTPSRASTTR
jgi:hypothetical protein